MLRLGALAGLAVAALGSCTTAPAQPRAIGPDVYELTRRTAPAAARAETQRVDLELDAAAYCGQQGKALSVLESRAVAADPPDYPTATVQFRCVPR